MAFIYTRTCCCCFSTRTGCIIIGAFKALRSLMMTFMLFFKPEDTEASSKDYPVLTYIALSIHLMNIITSCLLVYGAIQDKRFCLVPWLFFSVLFVVPTLVVVTMTNTARPRLKGIFITVMDIMYGIYFFLVVHSHFFILKEAQEALDAV